MGPAPLVHGGTGPAEWIYLEKKEGGLRTFGLLLLWLINPHRPRFVLERLSPMKGGAQTPRSTMWVAESVASNKNWKARAIEGRASSA